MAEKSAIEWTPAPLRVAVDDGNGRIEYMDVEGALVCGSLALFPDDPDDPEY